MPLPVWSDGKVKLCIECESHMNGGGCYRHESWTAFEARQECAGAFWKLARRFKRKADTQR